MTTAETMAMVTSPGMVCGTAGYMAPEQVRAEPVDHRCDIFAFGAVLYEMLAGRPAFAGSSAIEKMHAVAPDVILVAKSNAGMPELVDLRAVYCAEPPVMAEAGLAFRAAGARIIGACCGSTPAHLAAMAEALGVPAG